MFFEKSNDIFLLAKKFDSVFSLDLEKETKADEIPEEILNLANQRKIARENKDYAKSDEIRNLISSKGYTILDTKEGFEIKKI